MYKKIEQEYFNQKTVKIARNLLGKYLVRRIGNNVIAKMITEVEAYDGPRDKASHASRGRTERTKIMFGDPGHFYVYLCYGMHWMLNIVTGPRDFPAAILIRATEDINGPARLTKFLKIDSTLNGKPVGEKCGLWLEDRGMKINRRYIKKGPRIGVAYAGPYWAGKHYRFWLDCKAPGGLIKVHKMV